MELKKLCEGRMLPPIDIGREHYEGLFRVCLKCVSEATAVPSEDILGRRRPKDVSDARMMVYKMCRHEIGTGHHASKNSGEDCPSLKWIGDKFGRDHGAVLHGVRAVSDHMTVDKKLYAKYIKALSLFEIERGLYLSSEVKHVTNLQIHALQNSVDTIKKSIEEHEEALRKTEEMLEESKGGIDEDMVQEQCSSDG